MSLRRLNITHLRNLSHVDIQPSATFNLIVGANGSGKTSLLEAIYYLSLARSFRSRQNRSVIHLQQDTLTVSAQLHYQQQLVQIGVEKKRNGQSRVRIDGCEQTSVAPLAQILPLLLINADSYQLITGSSRFRRQFLDWGVFHVKQSFMSIWQDYSRVLKQRNSALRNKASKAEIEIWSNSLVSLAEQLDALRQQYITAFHEVFAQVLNVLLDVEVTLNYKSGWQGELAAVLEQNLLRDRQLGYTEYGAHRADISLKHHNFLSKEIFSRGQQKLLFFALKLAQGVFLQQQTECPAVYLIDDLAAELDPQRRQLIASLLKQMQAQVFITGVDEAAMREFVDFYASKLFHVKQGIITPIEKNHHFRHE